MRRPGFPTCLVLFGLALLTHLSLHAQTPVDEAHALCAADATGNGLTSARVLGEWMVEWSGGTGPGSGRLTLKANPEHVDSLIGRLDLGAARHWIAGDVDEGLLTLEESPDGTRISANWSLRPTPAPCGPGLSGQWIGAADEGTRSVRLYRPGRW